MTPLTTHTPGPWKVIPPGHGHHTEYLCVQYGADEMYTSLEMLPADARLCAAAPDLLEALKNLLRDEKLDDGDERLGKSRAQAALAIAKAEGMCVCSHSFAQHKGPVQGSALYCRHCPCPEWEPA